MNAIEKLTEYANTMKKEGLMGYALSIESLLPELQNKPAPRKESDTEKQMRENCESIRDKLEAFAKGYLYDTETNEMVCREDIENENGICDVRYQDFYAYYIMDNLGIKIMHDIQSPDELYSCTICVAWGGPGIYIDTYTECVEGYWWGERCSVPFSSEVTRMINAEVEDIASCYR